MKRRHAHLFFMLLFCVISSRVHAGSFDDFRFFPAFLPPVTNITEYSSAQVDWFVTTASWAYATSEEKKPLFALFGDFNLNNLASALPLVGIPNPLRPDLQNVSLPFLVNGIMHTQAFMINGEYMFAGDAKEKRGAWSLGSTIMALCTNAAYRFDFNKNECSLKTLTPSDIAEIENTRSKIFSLLGIVGDHAGEVGFGDISVYLRHFHNWDFVLKCRAIQAALSLAVLIPTGMRPTLEKPHMVPLGGNGQTGIRLCAQGIFQIKENIKLGCETAVSQRFSKTLMMRIPVNEEPYIFGAAVGDIEIRPGTTVRFSPYFLFEHVQDNLNLGVQYTLIHHGKDDWIDKRDPKNPPATIEFATKASAFSSEYITVFGFYEFNVSERTRSFSPFIPTLQLLVDFPVSFFDVHFTPRTYRATVNFSVHF